MSDATCGGSEVVKEDSDMSESEWEQGAHDAILQWCRGDGKRAVKGHPGMRVTYGTERHCVIDLDVTEPKPGKYVAWERQPVTYAEGDTWLECLVQLKNKGLIK